MHVSNLFLPEVRAAIDEGDLESLRTVFEDLHPSDLAELLTNLDHDSIAKIILMLRAPKGIEVFEKLSLQTQAKVLSKIGRQEAVKILEELPADDRVDLLQKLRAETVETLLPLMAQAERDDVRKLLQYGEHTAGALMTTEYAALPGSITASEALQQLRMIAPDSETIYYIYITDPERHLLGAISLRELVIAHPTEVVQEIMKDNPIFFTVDQDREEVARAMQKYDLLAVPVVDGNHRLVGIVTHDDAVDVIVAEQSEDVQMMAAIEPLHEPYFSAGFWSLARKRGQWLMFIFLGELFTGTALRHYEATFGQALALVFFVPLIISSGGNSGSQSVTLVTRSLALGEVNLRDFFRIFRREVLMGLTLGLFLGVLGFIRALTWHSPLNLAAAVGSSLVGCVLVGSLVGALLPLFFKRIGLDPAIMSAPFVASLVDVVGIVIYFTIAKLILF